MDDSRAGPACLFCQGSGKCGKCEGTGVRTIERWFPRMGEIQCIACAGSGKCQLCSGKGRSDDCIKDRLGIVFLDDADLD